VALESTSKPTVIKAEAEPTESTRTTTATSPRKLATADQKGKEKVATSHQEQDLPTKSLLRSLHGPSAGKAGLIRDPEETRQIIYEASKGSKYFQAQQQRDLDLTVRVDKLVAYLDKLVKERGGNVRAEEDRVDEMLKEMEKERVLTETVAVVDAGQS
jgi:DNA polymerase kappa